MSLLRNRFAEGYPAFAFIAEVREEFAARKDVTATMAGHRIAADGYAVPADKLVMLVTMTPESFDQFRAEVFQFFEHNSAYLVRGAAAELRNPDIDVENLWSVTSEQYAAFQDGQETLRDAADLAASRLGVEVDFMRGFFQDLHAEFNGSMFRSPFLPSTINHAYHRFDLPRRPAIDRG